MNIYLRVRKYYINKNSKESKQRKWLRTDMVNLL